MSEIKVARRGQKVRRKWGMSTVTDRDVGKDGTVYVRLDNEQQWRYEESVVAEHNAYDGRPAGG